MVFRGFSKKFPGKHAPGPPRSSHLQRSIHAFRFGVITTGLQLFKNLATPLAEIMFLMNTIHNVTKRPLRLIYNSSSLKKRNDKVAFELRRISGCRLSLANQMPR